MPARRRTARRSRSSGSGCLGLLAGLLLLYYGAQVVLRTPPMDPFQVIAHRGGPRYAPENTLAAFQSAIDRRDGALEFDVQMTQDGKLVVIHDETVDRTTSGTGLVADQTLAEIGALDAGRGERVPTFAEVVALAKAAGIPIYPETKSAHLYPGIEEKILAELAEAGYLDQTVIQSFEADSLTTLQRLNPDAKLCALYGLWKLSVSAPPADAQAVCPMAEMVLLNPGMIRQAHLEGRRVYVWFGVVEHPLLVRVMRFMGADGVMVDDPVAAK